jgi:hypothetical protein
MSTGGLSGERHERMHDVMAGYGQSSRTWSCSPPQPAAKEQQLPENYVLVRFP